MKDFFASRFTLQERLKEVKLIRQKENDTIFEKCI